MKTIDFTLKGKKYSIPNTWEGLPPKLYEQLFVNCLKMSEGELSPDMVRILYICDALELRYHKIKDNDAMSNIIMLSEKVTFPFCIHYKDEKDFWDVLPATLQVKARHQHPSELPDSSWKQLLLKKEPRFTLQDVFCAQLTPYISLQGEMFQGYKVNTNYHTLTCSLTALQFIEAREVLSSNEEMLPLLAAILYAPLPYHSEYAHELADKFAALPVSTLLAISFNFRSLVNYIFTRTHFDLLTKCATEEKHTITTGALESLYNLSGDGLGNIEQIEQMNVISYLTLLRKKTIDAVKSLSSADMKRADIANETGLPLNIINQII
jgi:hypothetical protein